MYMLASSEKCYFQLRKFRTHKNWGPTVMVFVSQTFTVLSNDELMNMPVSKGYQATEETPNFWRFFLNSWLQDSIGAAWFLFCPNFSSAYFSTLAMEGIFHIFVCTGSSMSYMCIWLSAPAERRLFHAMWVREVLSNRQSARRLTTCFPLYLSQSSWLEL